MTAKEKALSLFDWYYSAICDLIPVADGYERASRYNAVKPKAKRCALIAVDEIINCDHFFKTLEDTKEFSNYWNEVQNEIEKL
jgi:hypothetical protein